MDRQYPPVLRDYNDAMWTDSEAAMKYQRDHGSYLFVAMTLYNAALEDGGRMRVRDLVVDWGLNSDDEALLMATVKEAWAKGRWRDWRRQTERRGS